MNVTHTLKACSSFCLSNSIKLLVSCWRSFLSCFAHYSSANKQTCFKSKNKILRYLFDSLSRLYYLMRKTPSNWHEGTNDRPVCDVIELWRKGFCHVVETGCVYFSYRKCECVLVGTIFHMHIPCQSIVLWFVQFQTDTKRRYIPPDVLTEGSNNDSLNSQPSSIHSIWIVHFGSIVCCILSSSRFIFYQPSIIWIIINKRHQRLVYR